MDPHSKEYPKHVIGLFPHIICPREVWNGFADYATPETAADWLGLLTPDLNAYFRKIADDDDFAQCEREKDHAARRLVIDWYAKHTG